MHEFIQNPVSDFLSVEIGSGSGFTALKALQSGHHNLHCVDVSNSMLDALRSRIPNHFHQYLTTIYSEKGLPDQELFEKESVGSVAIFRILHFLDGHQLKQAIDNIYYWLIPGGYVYVTLSTVYIGIWKAFLKVFEDRLLKGDLYPGVLTKEEQKRYCAPGQDWYLSLPDVLQLFTIETATQAFKQAGFAIEKSGYIDRSGILSPIFLQDGREELGLIAKKPK